MHLSSTRRGRPVNKLVTRLARLARSTRDLLSTLDEIGKRDAGLRSLADAWAETTTLHAG
jgi:DNA invertase Pin-like site-specific DNA recombinase